MALGPLYASRPAVFLPTHAFVRRPAEWLRAISRHRATVSFAPELRLRPLRAARQGCRISRAWTCRAGGWRAAGPSRFTRRRSRRLPIAFARVGFARRASCPGTASPNTSWPRRSRRAAGRFAPTARSSAAACRCPVIVCGSPTSDGADLPEREVGEITAGRTIRHAGLLRERRVTCAPAGRRLAADRRPGLPGRRRTVRLRQGEGSHHRQRPQDLSAGPRVGRRRAGRASAAAGRSRSARRTPPAAIAWS